jgi:NAD-dependent deacetylase
MDALADARGLLEGAGSVCVLTGAGVSTASGIPDFRGPEGIWTKDPAAEALSSYETWIRDPDARKRAWRQRVASRGHRPSPNAGHMAIVALERSGRLHTLVTQNVDGLHHDAGNEPGRIVEIHGSARYAVCLRCGDRGPIEPVLDRVSRGEEDPTCLASIRESACAGMLKSATISFGQSLVAADLARAERAAATADVLVAVGSTLSVWPVAGMVPLARSNGHAVVVVNGGPTAMDDLASVVVCGPIEELLPQMTAGLSAADHER